MSALNSYSEEFKTFPRSDIEKITAIEIPKNKRNGLKQEQHLSLARRRKKDMKEFGISFKRTEGRPIGSGTKKEKVLNYIKKKPSATPTEIARELEVSRTTVYKYLKDI